MMKTRKDCSVFHEKRKMEQFFSARRSNMKEVREFIMKCVFLLTACVSIAAVVLICIFMFANGLPAIGKIGPLNFLLGEKWKPMNNIFGILPMIIGCNCRSYYYRCADRIFYIGIPGKIL